MADGLAHVRELLRSVGLSAIEVAVRLRDEPFEERYVVDRSAIQIDEGRPELIGSPCRELLEHGARLFLLATGKQRLNRCKTFEQLHIPTLSYCDPPTDAGAFHS
jgi:hypothetical protein